MFTRINLVFWILSICSSIVALYLLLGIENRQKDTRASYLSYVQIIKLSDELRQSSDDLTRFARAYAATGDGRYKIRFQTVLDIRNGRIPRPQGYERAYWDLEIAGELGTVGEGEAKSLRDRLIENDLDAYSIRKLGDSKLMSERLATIEADAFRAVRQGNFEDALNLLYGKEYHLFKSRIMKPIISVQERIEANGKRRLENYEKKYRKTRTIIIALTLTSIIFGLLAGFFSTDSLNVSSEKSA